MKKVLLVLSVVAMTILVGCRKEKIEEKKETALKVGIVLSTGGLGDKSFNDSAYRGLEKAKKELGIEFKYVEPATQTENVQYLKEFAEAGYDLVIGTGYTMTTDVETVSKQFPNIKFAMIDETVDTPNTKSLVFKEEEGSFLVGAVAGMMSKSGIIGFVGGEEVPLIKRFQSGYEQGAKYINPKIKLLTVYIGGDNPYGDAVRAKEITVSEIRQGADVVYHAAGSSGIGVINAAKENKKYAIGVDSDQDDVAQGTVLTSMIKNVDVAVFDTVKEVKDGTFKAGTTVFGVKENGVGTSEFKYTKELIGDENLKKIEELKAKIASGEIIVKP